MCLSTVCMDTGDTQKEIMKDVARIEAEGSGFWMIDLFGEKTFVEGNIQSIDLVDENRVILTSSFTKE
jgi:predicted RNA-binding protein